MNNTELALFLFRLNRIFQEAHGPSRSSKAAAKETIFRIVAGLRREQTQARRVPELRFTPDDARCLILGVVECLERAGMARPDIAITFNSAIRGLPAPDWPQLPTPEIPNGFVLVRNDVLTSLAAGTPVSVTESTDASQAS